MSPEAVVVGAGPNGLAAAITLARAGRTVEIYEGAETVGGGCRSDALTLPGYVHDVCSAVYPLAAASPFFKDLPLSDFGLELVYSPAQLVHPLDGQDPVGVVRSVEETAAGLGHDESAYLKLMQPLVRSQEALMKQFLGPFRLPTHPIATAAFGLRALRSAEGLGKSLFKGEMARAWMAGMAGHSMLPLDASPSAGFALMLGLLCHSAGWPVAKGGSRAIADAMAAYLKSLGGEIHTSAPIASIDDLPAASVYLLDVTPRQLVRIAGSRLPERYVSRLRRYRYGCGVFKIDWALAEPVPWISAACRSSATLHLGGSFDEIAHAEKQVDRGEHPERPFVLFSQPSLFDSARAPEGGHTAWAYCHVPHGSKEDMTKRIEAQVERFAPGFREVVAGRSTMNTEQLQSRNPNLIGGDINGGRQDLTQLFTRPVARVNPYTTPDPTLFICSSSTPPGGGVHGMCGHFAARAALKRLRDHS